MDLEQAIEEYKKWYRKVHKAEVELRALREERSRLLPEESLSDEGRRGRMKALKRIWKKQDTLVQNISNASQKRNKALSDLEEILKRDVVLETK